MSTISEIAARLKEARKLHFKTASAAAESLGVNRATYYGHERGEDGFSMEQAIQYARRYRVSLDWLMRGKGQGPTEGQNMFVEQDDNVVAIGSGRQPRPNASFPPIYQRFPGDVSVMLRGQTVGGPNGRFVFNGDDSLRIICPPGLENVPEAYAVRVHGTSMEPRFKAGETVWLNPREPYRSGDDVVVQLKAEKDGDVPESYIKEYRSQNSGTLRLWQWNPGDGETNELEFPVSRIFQIHKIVHHAML